MTDSNEQFVVKIETLFYHCLKGENSRKILKFGYRVSKIKKSPKIKILELSTQIAYILIFWEFFSFLTPYNQIQKFF